MFDDTKLKLKGPNPGPEQSENFFDRKKKTI